MSYFICDEFEKDLDVVMVYERLIDITKTTATNSNALNFLSYCMIGQWRLNYDKPLLTQLQLFGMPPLDARQWEH